MKKHKKIMKLISFILSIILVIGTFSMVPPLKVEASKTITADADFTVLQPISVNSVSVGDCIYLTHDESINGKLATKIDAYVEVIDPDTYRNTLSYNDGHGTSFTYDASTATTHKSNKSEYGRSTNCFYVIVRNAASEFDGCRPGYIWYQGGSWWYRCWWGGSGPNKDVSYNMLKQVRVTKEANNAKITVTTKDSADSKLEFSDENEPSKNITKDDIQEITYEYYDANGNHIGAYEIPVDQYRVANGTITFDHPSIGIEYGLNFQEYQDVLLPVSYLISFDTHGGTGAGPYTQTMYLVESLINEPAAPTRGANETFWHWARENSQTAPAWKFDTDRVSTVMTLHAIYRNNQVLTAEDKTVTYGDDEQSIVASRLGGATLSYEVVSGNDVIGINSSTGVITTKKVGTATVKVKAAETNTYTPAETTVTVTVNKRDVDIVADAKEKIYGTNDPELTYHISDETPLVHGDTISSAFTGSIIRNTGENVGDYMIIDYGVSSTNYNVRTYTPANLTIKPRKVTVTAEDKSKIYGLDDPELTYTISEKNETDNSGLLPDDTLDIIIERDEGEVVRNDYVITPSQAEGANPNYDITFVNGTFQILPADVKITNLTAEDKYYDGTTEATVTVTVEGVNGETFEIENLKGEFASKDVLYDIDNPDEILEQPVVISGLVVEGTGKFDNYTYNGIPLSADIPLPVQAAKILPRPIDVVAYDNEKYYGENDPELTWGLGEDSTLALMEILPDIVEASVEREAGEQVNDYVIKITGTSNNRNYDVTFVDGNFKIKPFEYAAIADVDSEDESDKVVNVVTTDDDLLDIVLSDEDKKMVKEGAGIRVYFEINKLLNISADERGLINGVLPEGYIDGLDYDISLFKKYSFKPEPEQLHETASPVGFDLDIPDTFPAKPENAEREYIVIRVHDGKAEIIPSTYNAEKNTIHIDTDKFSTYAIAYKDTIIKKDKGVKTGVKTGDSMDFMFFIAMMIGSIIGAACVLYRKRRLNIEDSEK